MQVEWTPQTPLCPHCTGSSFLVTLRLGISTPVVQSTLQRTDLGMRSEVLKSGLKTFGQGGEETAGFQVGTSLWSHEFLAP